jgi:magnesium-transporting ATPase (P-type)
MANSENTSIESLDEELSELIRHRTKYEGIDFQLSHYFVWTSILTSFFSSIFVASGGSFFEEHNIWFSILAGIPGLCVVIEKTFDFARRSFWGTMYKIDLQELKDEIEFGNIEKREAAKRLREIMRKNESDFIKIGSFFQNRERSDSQKQDTKTADNATNTSLKATK